MIPTRPNAKYLLGSMLSLPLLPLMYYQGRQVRARVPVLPEARGAAGLSRFAGDTPGSAARKLTLVALGESTIAGVGVQTHEEGFTGTLARALADRFSADVAWKVYARSGYNARSVAQKLVPQITEPHADLIVVGLGGNDAFELNSPQQWQRHVAALIDALRARFPYAPVLFCNMPPIKEFPAFPPLLKLTIGNLVEVLGEALDDLVKDYDRVYYYRDIITFKEWSVRLGVSGEPADFFCDGIHPSKLTYQTWAKDVATVIWREEMVNVIDR